MRRSPADSYSGCMSDNYKAYVQKMTELRTHRAQSRPLRKDLAELLALVRDCEARWALEERIDGRSNQR